ncbi:hypothetical protein M407DRAFT_31625 [Tulasnella calospora MUT 4182]|uniref:Uncharacterized protein n=1 Tax=Tulasnella calospora MUT 4182 TaxID=1051891 RepID=A0A0C3LB28_9AGAM|nr:hypothetical protein M407DRAFT_31625 [Tulasnella calospora MUT 4182]
MSTQTMLPLLYTAAALCAGTYIVFGRPRWTNKSSPSGEPVVTEEPQSYEHPFITLLVAWSMTLDAFKEWLRFTCMENADVAQATNGKAKDIWNNMLDPLFTSLAAEDGDDPPVIFMHEAGDKMEPDGVAVEWLNNLTLQLADVWSAIAYIMSVSASFDDRERTKDWYLELLMVFSILLRKIALSSSNTLEVPSVVHILWTDRRELILQPFPQNTLLTSRPQSPSPVKAVPGHALGSMPPTSILWDKLKEYRKAELESALKAADLQNNTNTFDKFTSLPAHESSNLGQCAETVPYLCVMGGGLKPGTKLYGLSFKPEWIGRAMENFEASNVDASALLLYLHPRGFMKACPSCCSVLLAMNVQYSQYKRRPNGKTLLQHLNGVNEPCGTEL